MRLELFDYKLPKNLIAQKQIKPRDHSRLLVIDKRARRTNHDFFYKLDKYLEKGDVLVFNDSKVFPARLKMSKETAGKVEVFLLNDLKNRKWEVLVGGKIKKGDKLKIIELECEILDKLLNGRFEVRFNIGGKKFRDILDKVGETPLPPYIKIKDSKKVREDYQTVYAKKEGSVAAPTAGFHFTPKVFSKLKKKGVKMEFVTLHVGLGTFQPVKSEKIEKHEMHVEYVILDKGVTERLNRYKKEGRRIIGVGTTSARVLEAMSDKKGKLKAGSKWINIFIYPPYKFKFIDGLITNFHLPKSTLLMLVAALTGRKFILKVYKEAIKKKYRFYSFGDGMLIK